MALVLLSLASLSVIISGCTHVAITGVTLFLFMPEWYPLHTCTTPSLPTHPSARIQAVSVSGCCERWAACVLLSHSFVWLCVEDWGCWIVQ